MDLIEKYLGEGEQKKATWTKKFKQLEYWTSRNTSTSVDCDSLKKAKAIIKNSGVDQKLVTEAKGEFVHVYNDQNDEYEWTVVHSVHNVPQMGGQTIKNFKTKEKAEKFAKQMAKKWNATLAKWTKKGQGAGAKYISN